MADESTGKNDKQLTKRVSFVYFHKLSAAVSLIAFLVTLLAGVMAGARVITIVYRSVAVLIVVGVVSRILIHVLATYEEMNSGKA